MAASSAIAWEGFSDGKRIKVYTITHDGSDTEIAITPGSGYVFPIGGYTDYTESSGAFTFAIAAGTSGEFSNVAFLSK